MKELALATEQELRAYLLDLRRDLVDSENEAEYIKQRMRRVEAELGRRITGTTNDAGAWRELVVI